MTMMIYWTNPVTFLFRSFLFDSNLDLAGSVRLLNSAFIFCSITLCLLILVWIGYQMNYELRAEDEEKKNEGGE